MRVFPALLRVCFTLLLCFHWQVEDLLAEVGLLLRNGLQCLRMLLWLRFTGNSRGRGEAFQLEVGDPELSEHDFGVDDEEALMLGGRPMSSKKNTPEKVRRGPEPSHVDSTNLPPTLAGRRPHNVAAKLADSSAFSARGAVSFTGEDTELEVAVTPTTRLRAGGALQ